MRIHDRKAITNLHSHEERHRALEEQARARELAAQRRAELMRQLAEFQRSALEAQARSRAVAAESNRSGLDVRDPEAEQREREMELARREVAPELEASASAFTAAGFGTRLDFSGIEANPFADLPSIDDAGAVNPDLVRPDSLRRPDERTGTLTAQSTGHAIPRPGPVSNPPIGNTQYYAEYGPPVDGDPFIQAPGDPLDIDPNDIRQGLIGDCYFLSALATIADREPERIRNMVRDLGDGTYLVVLPRNPRDLAIRVTPELPVDRNGNVAFAQIGDVGPDGKKELWVALIEKAYAEYKDSYAAIHQGKGSDALTFLTGEPSTRVDADSLDIHQLADLFAKGAGMTAGTFDEVDGKPLYANGTISMDHAYWIEKVDPAAGTVTLRNPHGYDKGPLELSWNDFVTYFDKVSINPL